MNNGYIVGLDSVYYPTNNAVVHDSIYMYSTLLGHIVIHKNDFMRHTYFRILTYV